MNLYQVDKVDNRQSARLKVENLHYELTEDDLNVTGPEWHGADSRVYSVRLEQFRVYG